MTKSLSRYFIMAALAFSLAAGDAAAAERIVNIQKPPALGKDRDAYPRIAAPADEAERKINAAVARLDARLEKSLAECGKNAGRNGGDWSRMIEVTMRGPRYLSYTITDNVYCGGAHPDIGDTAIVYDLTTGAPVDWSQLLPPELVGVAALNETMDGTKMVTLQSRRLYDLYMQNYRLGSHADAKDCIDAMQEAGADGPPAITPYLDAKTGGLGIEFDVAHVVAACVDPVVLPLATLREEKTPELTLKAIEAAHAASK
jgi:hypothetical protein